MSEEAKKARPQDGQGVDGGGMAVVARVGASLWRAGARVAARPEARGARPPAARRPATDGES